MNGNMVKPDEDGKILMSGLYYNLFTPNK